MMADVKNNTEELTYSSLKTAAYYSDNLMQGVEQCIAYLHEDRINKAAELVTYIVDGLIWITEILVLTQQTHGIKFDRQEFEVKIKLINEMLENRDYVSLKDIFEYELLEEISSWQKGLYKYLKQI